MARIVVIGASGHGKKVAEVLQRAGEHTVVGFVDSRKPVGTSWFGLEVVGSLDDIAVWSTALDVTGGVVAVGDNATRARLAAMVTSVAPEFEFVRAIDPTAYVGTGATVAPGVVVMPGAMVGVDCVIDAHALLDTRSSLDHDGRLGRAASLAPGVTAGGNVQIGDLTAVGIGATVIHGRTIGAGTVVGAGSVVVRDLPDQVVAYGSPARVQRTRREGERYL